MAPKKADPAPVIWNGDPAIGVSAPVEPLMVNPCTILVLPYKTYMNRPVGSTTSRCAPEATVEGEPTGVRAPVPASIANVLTLVPLTEYANLLLGCTMMYPAVPVPNGESGRDVNDPVVGFTRKPEMGFVACVVTYTKLLG